jgi:glutaconyl-CoA/methylmalonyl-CoA decarboxylase subunit gamma
MKYRISVQDQSFEIEIGTVTGDVAAVTVDNMPYMVRVENLSASGPHHSTTVAQPVPTPSAIAPKPLSKQAGGEIVIAPIPGIILSISVNVGDSVTTDQVVAIIEAMKMENELTSHVSGTVKEIRAPKGTEVATGDVVMVIA